ncbi:MAG: hypothetical protein LUG16_00335 [Candidatus Gastranaerophilales bacterium]|nr:hypothetical protein [Candidatus Gastranaerophilales bacterium]
MGKIIIYSLLIFICAASCCYAKDSSESSSVWGSDTSVFSTGFEDQEPVSDSKVKKTIEAIKQQQMSRQQRKIQRDVNPLSPLADEEHLKEFVRSQSPDDDLSQTLTVMIPVAAYKDDGTTIPPGYYKLSCRKTEQGEYMLDLSQGTQRILSVNAKQTQQDLEQDTISFCNAEIIDDYRIRLMYGSMDLNLAGYLYFK